MKKKLVLIIVACVVVLAVVLAVVLSGGKTADTGTEPPQAPVVEPTLVPTVEPTATPGVAIEMAHGTILYVAEEYAANLVHEQEVNGAVTTDVFYMLTGEEKTGIYRFHFGPEEADDWLGILKTEAGDVIVTYTAFVVSEDELAALGEGASDIYYALMNSFNDALNAIVADPRFSVEKPLAVGEDTAVKTTYWTLTLPSNMTVVETNESGTYVATFYGEVAGERTALYTVHMGDNKAESELGLYEVDGVKKPISVGSFDLTEKPDWTEDDYSAAYRMMDTINHVIETIMSSEQFSMPSEEPVVPNAAQ